MEDKQEKGCTHITFSLGESVHMNYVHTYTSCTCILKCTISATRYLLHCAVVVVWKVGENTIYQHFIHCLVQEKDTSNIPAAFLKYAHSNIV